MGAARHPLARLLELPRYRDAPRLDVFAHLVRPLREGAWWRRLDAVKVTGSSGKGSVATMVAAVLQAALREASAAGDGGENGGENGDGAASVGLTVSPHIHEVGERLQVGGVSVPRGELEEALAVLEPRLASAPAPPLAFEAVTALALEVFARRGVQAVVAEAGIGGRHDTVRRLPGRLGILVSVDYEHTAILGADLEEIARDKADLVDEGATLLTGRLDPAVRRAVREHGRRRGVRVLSAEVEDQDEETLDETLGEGLRHAILDSLPVLGEHQAENAVLATLAAHRWLGRHVPGWNLERLEAAALEGLAGVRLPGRLERLEDLSSEIEVWVDIAHAPDSIRRVAAAVRRHVERPLLLLLGVSSDKDPRLLAPPLVELATRVVVTRARERGGDPAPVAELVRRAGKPVQVVEPIEEAVRRAIEDARRHGLVVLVAGGLFLAREAAAAARSLG